MQFVQRHNSTGYFESLADGLRINSFILLVSSSAHLSAKTVLSKRAQGTCLRCSKSKMGAASMGSPVLRRLAEQLCTQMPPVQSTNGFVVC